MGETPKTALAPQDRAASLVIKYIDRPDLTKLSTLPTLPIILDPLADFYGIPPTAIALLGCFAVKCNAPSISRKRSHSPHLPNFPHIPVLSNCVEYLIVPWLYRRQFVKLS
ncbi:MULTISPECIES: hypothetical protein [Moorena]|uniref:hypothetical protein n=1 Tax=Moorena TaxID=1155738 RepID=UPI0012B576D2|nr:MULTISPECIES: hypothetical protein [Moorena]NEP64231.1 hypothetical protein [Moorena sp. SIO3A5]